MFQIANEDAVADLVCCGEVYEVKIPVTIAYDFKVQMLDSLVNFFLGHGMYLFIALLALCRLLEIKTTARHFDVNIFFKLFFMLAEPHEI